MQSRLLSDDHGTRTYVSVFGKGDEILSGLTPEVSVTDDPVTLHKRHDRASGLGFIAANAR